MASVFGQERCHTKVFMCDYDFLSSRMLVAIHPSVLWKIKAQMVVHTCIIITFLN
jgi:hypothetical protein